MKQAIILCGGESSRFWPFTDKNSFTFLGKPLVIWHVEQLFKIGFETIIIVVNELNSAAIKKAIESFSERVIVVVQKGRGQAQAILATGQQLNDASVFVINGSDIYDTTFLKNLTSDSDIHKKSIVLGAVKRETYFPGGYLKLDQKGYVTEIVEKPKPGTEPSDVIRIVADCFPNGNELVRAIDTYGTDESAGYETAINGMISSGKNCRPHVTAETMWAPIKYPWHILDVMRIFLSQIESHKGKHVQIKNNVTIEGTVYIEDGVRIFENTKIVGPCYIGMNTIIGNNSMIRESHIGANCVTGFNTDITRSYIGDNCWFHSNYIGDSVLDGNVSMGSGAVLANLRLDDGEIFSLVKKEKLSAQRNKLGALIGEGVRIGVNASIMPGVKIGKNTFVGSGVVLGRDLPEEAFCAMKPGYVITKNLKVAAASREEFKRKI